MTYKPEIDGLRAIAVLLVLICHMQLGMPGGYVGVDVFFVISGYLITSIVVAEVEKKRFSFVTFYGKRFVRLYPALIATTLLTFAVGFLIADPLTLENIARTGRYTLTFTSNIFFSKHQGYFDYGIDTQLFLHTWSLAVEWQFYLIWPMLIVIALKASRRALIILLSIITLGSLIAAYIAVGKKPTSAYYLMPYRAFELGIGALLVFAYPYELKPANSAALTLTGLTAIFYSGFFFTPNTPFPSLPALVPCLGAAACIWGGKGFLKGNALRWPALVSVGKISYSVYLVHWPILLFYRYYVFREINLVEKIALALASLLLGALLYKLIEARITWKNLANKTRGCIAILAFPLLMIPAFHYVSKSGEGLPWRLNEKQSMVAQEYIGSSSPMSTTIPPFGASASVNASTGNPIAIMMGDSFAAHYYTGIKEYLEPKNQYIQAIFNFGCFIAPVYPDLTPNRPDLAMCNRIYEQTVEQVRQQNLPLIVAQDWLLYYQQEPIGGQWANRFETEEAFFTFIDKHLATVQRDIGDNPLIITSLPPYYRYHFNVAQCLIRPDYLPQVCTQQAYTPYAYSSSLNARINAALQAYAQTHDNTYFVDVSPALCPDGICNAQNDIKLYNDGRHFSPYGSRIAAQKIMPEIERLIHGTTRATP